MEHVRICFLLPIIFVVICYFLKALINFAHKKRGSVIFKPHKRLQGKTLFVVIFAIILSGQLIYWFAYYPGGFNLDAYGQWDQVHGLMRLNNWHPVFTTFIYWLITRIYDSFAFCIFVQLITFSFSISCLCHTLNKYGIPGIFLVFTAVYISLYPAIGMNNICLYKDVLFTIATIWALIILINIIVTNGSWLYSKLHLFYTVLLFSAVTLIRHNGIFYILPCIVILFLVYKSKILYILKISVIYILAINLIQGPIYNMFNVEHHSNFVGETVGIPMAIMANSFIYDSENTPNDVNEFLLSVADKYQWEENYILGEWDSCKWNFGGINLFKDENLGKFLKLTLETIISSPETSYQALRENTRVVWQIIGTVEWSTWVYIEPNDYGIEENHNIFFLNIVNNLLAFSLSLFGGFLCWNIGVPTALLIIFTFISISKKEYGKLLYSVPIICYNLFTMLLLCGPSHRYFYFNSVLILPIICGINIPFEKCVDAADNCENI